ERHLTPANPVRGRESLQIGQGDPRLFAEPRELLRRTADHDLRDGVAEGAHVGRHARDEVLDALALSGVGEDELGLPPRRIAVAILARVVGETPLHLRILPDALELAIALG